MILSLFINTYNEFRLNILFIIFLTSCYESKINYFDAKIVEVIDDTSSVDHFNCSNPVCDPILQCGCPEDYMCTIIYENSSSSRVCVRPIGEKKEGESCNAYDCAPGLICSDDAICRKICKDNSDCTRNGECYRSIVGDELFTCNVWCNLITGENCPETLKCIYVYKSLGNYFSDCHISTGNSGYFEDCNQASDCLQGMFCMNDIGKCGGYICSKVCQPDPVCPEEMPICRNPYPFFGIIDGTTYSFCASDYEVDCFQ